MKRALAIVLTLVGFGGALLSQGLSVALAADAHAASLDMDDTVNEVSARYLSRGVDTATDDGAQLVIVLLDTPGGLFSSTRDMVETILNADIPVVVYVSPVPDPRPASAGTFIAAAGHVAAMAPTTNIGAASPVAGGGDDLPETLAAKATQDAAAFIRSIAEERGRNAEALEDTVVNAVSYSASEALENGIIDLIAVDVNDLMAQIDGMAIELKNGTTTLQTTDLEIVEIEWTPVERFLGFLADPNVAFILLSLGTLGIFIEILSPGLLVPGIAGAIMLALAFVALGNLPVNWVGVALLAFAMVLLFAEVQAPGIGVFGIAGTVSFVLGAFLLFGEFGRPAIPTPSVKVNIWLILAVAASMLGLLLFVVRDLVAARKAASAGDSTGGTLVGQLAVATTDLTPGGTLHVGGEHWTAVSDSGEPIQEGDEVLVTEAEGLTLKVFRPSESEAADEEGPDEDPAEEDTTALSD